MRACTPRDKRQEVPIGATVRRVALLRYDAFEDVGGRLSFSCALLDDHGTGVVLTSINGRQETRVYAKPVTAGTSTYNLRNEEQEAIRQALERRGGGGGGAMIFKRDDEADDAVEARSGPGPRTTGGNADGGQDGEVTIVGAARGSRAPWCRPGRCGSTGR